MNHGREEQRNLPIVVSSGSGSGNIAQSWDICRRIRVIPPSETDSFDITVLDGANTLVWKRAGWVGSLSEVQELSLGICKTISIANASSDGTYTVKFDMH